MASRRTSPAPRRRTSMQKDGRARRSAQQVLPFRTWGGARAGAGRKRLGPRPCVPHVARPDHRARHPVHVTMRAVRPLPSLRRQTLFLELRRAIALCSGDRFRVVHFSVQADHLHLIVEASDKMALSRGASGLAIRLARRVNGVVRRRGRVWVDRYHARPLSTPREVRRAIVYVLMNWKKHVPRARGTDPCASAYWFDGWRPVGRSTADALRSQGPPAPSVSPDWESDDLPPVRAARTWLGSVGWRRHGLVGVGEGPGTISTGGGA